MLNEDDPCCTLLMHRYLEDGAALLGQSQLVGSGERQPVVALAGVYAVSKAFLQDTLKQLEAPAAQRAAEAAAAGGSGGRKGVVGQGVDDGGSGGGRKGPRRGGGGRRRGGGEGDGSGLALREGEVETALLGWQPGNRPSGTLCGMYDIRRQHRRSYSVECKHIELEEHPELVRALVEELLPDARRLFDNALAAALSSLPQG